MVGPETFIAAPGVPLGVTHNAIEKVGTRILYDPLQLGTAAMAVTACFPHRRGKLCHVKKNHLPNDFIENGSTF